MLPMSALRTLRRLRPVPLRSSRRFSVQRTLLWPKNDLFTFELDLPGQDSSKQELAGETASAETLSKPDPAGSDASTLENLQDVLKQGREQGNDMYKDDLFSDENFNIEDDILWGEDQENKQMDMLQNPLSPDHGLNTSQAADPLENLDILSKYNFLKSEENSSTQHGSTQNSEFDVEKTSSSFAGDESSPALDLDSLLDFGLSKQKTFSKNGAAKDDLASDLAKHAPEDDLSDILADMSFEPSQSSEASELDRIFSDLAKGSGSADEEYRPVSVDNPEEEMQHSVITEGDIIDEEKRLFESIFETYTQKERESPNPKNLEAEVLWNLLQSFTKTNKGPQGKVISQELVSAPEIRQLLDEAKSSIEPTIELILEMKKPLELVLFLSSVFERYVAHDYDDSTFYLQKKKNESHDNFQKRANLVFQQILQACLKDPANPVLHEYTLPVIFNHIIRLLMVKFYNGKLALSLFNSLKEDISLYTIMCNQDTYNEMIKVYWIFMGKSSLCEIELLFVEMMNNGFRGNMATFAILKLILGEYHTMKMGKSLYNPGGLPVWSFEDERRATKLGEKLRDLSRHLRKTRYT